MDTICWEAIDKMKPLMDDLKGSKERSWDESSDVAGKGVYVFYEKGTPIYVGRSNNIQNRIREHGAASNRRLRRRRAAGRVVRYPGQDHT